MNEPTVISSRQNARLVRARKVRDGKLPHEIFVEGARLVSEVLRSNVRVLECFITDEMASTPLGQAVNGTLEVAGIPIVRLSVDLFRTISDTVHSQGIALIASRPETGRRVLGQAFRAVGAGPVVLLHEASDPSNVGAVCRTAEAAGAAGLILTHGSADAFSAKALRAGMGSNVRLPVWDQADVAGSIDWARSQGLRVVAADVNARESYAAIDWQKPNIVMFGSEAHGLDRSVSKLADDVITIPMKNGVESLNLAVSVGIVLFEALRQNS